MDSSSKETKEKQSKTGSKAKATGKSEQKVQQNKSQTSSKKAAPPPKKQGQPSGLTPQMGIQTLQSQQTHLEKSREIHTGTSQEKNMGEIPELYEFSKVKQETYYPNYTKTLNFLNDEEVENLKAKSTSWIKQTTQIATNDLTYGKCGGNFCYRHTKSVKGVVDIHPERVKRVKVPTTNETLYLVIVDPVVKIGPMQQFLKELAQRQFRADNKRIRHFCQELMKCLLAKHLIYRINH